MKAPFKIDESQITNDMYGNPIKQPQVQTQAVQAKSLKKEKNKEAKKYLLLIKYNDGTGDKTFEIIDGRTQTRKLIIEAIDEIDILNSYVLVEDVAFGEAMPTVYQFMKLIESDYSDGFLIDQYLNQKQLNDLENLSDEEREQRYSRGDIPPTYNKEQTEALFMNQDKENV